MYYDNKKLALSIFEIFLGIALIVLGIIGKIDSDVWSAVGTAIMAVGIGSVVRHIKYRTDERYRERIDTEVADERMAHLRLKAWAVAGYIFLFAAGVVTIIFLVMEKREQAMMLAFFICFILVVYLIAYLVLQKKN